MRRSKADTAETREQIVKTAAAEFRRKGLAGTGLAELMGAAGLTHGGFYRHFDSKDQLAVEACRDALVSMTEGMAAEAASQSPGDGLKIVVSQYLSPGHRDGPEKGCPLAALGSELGRAEEELRETAADGYFRLVNVLAGEIAGLPAPEARRRAMVIASAMIGAMTVSRFVTDRRASNALLSAMRDYLLNSLEGPC